MIMDYGYFLRGSGSLSVCVLIPFSWICVQIKFSVMQPGTHVWPHTGPTNCRLRMHLGLVIPKQGCRIRCTDQTRYWTHLRLVSSVLFHTAAHRCLVFNFLFLVQKRRPNNRLFPPLCWLFFSASQGVGGRQSPHLRWLLRAWGLAGGRQLPPHLHRWRLAPGVNAVSTPDSEPDLDRMQVVSRTW